MTEPIQTAAVGGLKFFGQMSASISHELKNALSIINESAGLLEDLSGLAEKGITIDTARVGRISASIRKQIGRTDEIIRSMNRFSHLVDEPFRQIEAGDFLRFVIALSRRLTISAGVNVMAEDYGSPLNIVTRPFYLHHLVWRVMQYCIHTAGIAGDLRLRTEPARNRGIDIVFLGLKTVPDKQEAVFGGHMEQSLMDLLGAALHESGQENTLRLFLPETSET